MQLSDGKVKADVAGNSPPPLLRRLFHAVGGSLPPLAGILLPLPHIAVILGVMAGGSLAGDLVRLRVSRLNRVFLRRLSPLLKREEDRRVTGATYLLIAAFLAFILFDPPVAVAVLLFLSLGDPAAALVGQRMPGPRFFGKSPVGTLAFIALSLLVVAVLAITGVAQYHWSFLAGAVAAGLVELLPLPVDDNLSIPLAAGAVIQFTPLLL